MIPNPIQPRAGLLRLRRIRKQFDAQRHTAAVSERMIVRMLRSAFEIEKRWTETLVDDFFHPRLFRFGQHLLPDKLLIDPHSTRPSPATVVAAAVMIALERATVRRLTLHLVAAVGGKKNVE